jgi:hypothetical protein
MTQRIANETTNDEWRDGQTAEYQRGDDVRREAQVAVSTLQGASSVRLPWFGPLGAIEGA